MKEPWPPERIDALAVKVGGSRALAALVGVHEVTVTRWRHGHRHPTSLKRAMLDGIERTLIAAGKEK